MPSLKDVPEGACPEDRVYCSDYKVSANGKCKFSKYAIPEISVLTQKLE